MPFIETFPRSVDPLENGGKQGLVTTHACSKSELEGRSRFVTPCVLFLSHLPNGTSSTDRDIPKATSLELGPCL